MLGLLINLLISIIFIVPLLKRSTSKDIFVIWGLYFSSNVLAFYFDPEKFTGFSEIDSYPTIYFIVYGILVFYVLTPLYKIKTKKLRPKIFFYNFSKNHKKILNFIILAGVYSIIYSTPFAIKSLLLGASEVRSVVLHDDSISVFPKTIWTTIAVASSVFFSYYISIYYLSINSNLKIIKKILLFVISFSYIIVSFGFTARDGMIFFLIFNLLLILNYWSMLTYKIKKWIVRIGVVILSLISSVLIIFTGDRFANFWDGITGYIGTQPIVFAENIKQRMVSDNDFYGISLRFPLLKMITGQEVEEISRTMPYEWTFGTFLTDFYNINGVFSLIFFTVIFTEFFKYHFKKSRKDPLYFTLIYTFYIHFIVSGFFYFRLGSFSGNVFIVISIILIINQNLKKRKLL